MDTDAQLIVPPPPKEHSIASLAPASSHRRRHRDRKSVLDALLSDQGALPRRASTLDQQCMLDNLPHDMAKAVAAYCALTFGDGMGDGSREVALCVEAAAETYPNGVRVKELFENFEAYHAIAAFAHDASKCRPIETIFDLACGHGMLGVLLAYRFPHRNIVCMDKSKRKLFDAFVAGFRKHGVPFGNESEPLSNLRFVEGDVTTLELPPRSMVVAVHACNELNRQIIETARAAAAVWAVLPCCIRAGTYLPCRVGGAFSNDDDAKHTLNCGVVAGQYGAERLQAIDRRITNRNILICGGAGFGSYTEARQKCAEPRPSHAH